jgi:hypothetical protein
MRLFSYSTSQPHTSIQRRRRARERHPLGRERSVGVLITHRPEGLALVDEVVTLSS